MPAPLYSFHFDIGDSTRGAIGACFRVTATTPQQALQLLRETLTPYTPGVGIDSLPTMGDDVLLDVMGLEYAEVYLTPEAITIDDIDSVETALGHEISPREWDTLFPEEGPRE